MKTANKFLLFFMLCNTVLVIARMAYTGQHYYLFLIWNLFLAYLPFAISKGLHQNGNGKITETIGTLLVWILFLPNAPYIITDFLHLGKSTKVPMWFDIILLFSSAINGLLMGVFSIIIMEKYLLKLYNANIANAIIYTSIVASGFGVFVGRYLRWNSWSVVTHPITLLQECGKQIIHPHQHSVAWIITGLFAGLLFLLVQLFKIIPKLFNKEKSLA